MPFSDRSQAGFLLAQQCKSLVLNHNPIVLALPRGGVPIAYEISVNLQIPLDVLLVRKLGLPQNQELAMGAIGGWENYCYGACCTFSSGARA